jgi:fructose-1,6-bisphosphatase
MKSAKGCLQGYNAQVVVSEDQVIITAEVTQECNDRRQLRPMMEATKENLQEVDKTLRVKTLLGDAGYFSSENVEGLKRNDPDVLLAVSKEIVLTGKRRKTMSYLYL